MEAVALVVLAVLFAKWLMSLGASEERERAELRREPDEDPDFEAQVAIDEAVERHEEQQRKRFRTK